MSRRAARTHKHPGRDPGSRELPPGGKPADGPAAAERISPAARRKLRTWYSVIVPLALLALAAVMTVRLRNELADRRTMQLLARAGTAAELDEILRRSGAGLPADRLAEVCIRCAMEAFGRKDYGECRKLLRKILDSDAHVEYRAVARLEFANACFLDGLRGEGLRELDLLLKSPDTPPDCRRRAAEQRRIFSPGMP